mgnify:CR=1 FL=1
MKHLLLIYLFATLLIFAAFAVLSFGYGNGYVYIYWRDWQFQSSALGLIALFIVISLLVQLGWLFGKRYFVREQRKKETVLNFKELHPYEQFLLLLLSFLLSFFQRTTTYHYATHTLTHSQSPPIACL